MPCRLLLEPFLRARKPLWIALAQVLVTYTLRTSEQRIVELDGIEIEIAFDILEPFRRIACGILQPQHLKSTFFLIATKGRSNIGFTVEIVGQRYRTFHGQLRSRAHRKMRGRGGISKQDDVLVAPAFAENTIEIEPGRTAQVTRIRHQLVATKIAGKDLFARRDTLTH